MSSSPERLKVLVVEGVTAVRHALVQRLGELSGVEVVGSALNGRTALPRIASLAPDLVLVDLGADFEDGCHLLQSLQGSGSGLRRVVVAPAAQRQEIERQSATWGHHAIVNRPNDEDGDRLVEGLLRELQPLLASSRGASQAPAPVASRTRAGRVPLVVGIGVSTGGPRALAEVLPNLPADFPVPILVVQHMPPKFTASLAESLDRHCALRVREARDGDRIAKGEILFAPGGSHMRVVAREGGERIALTMDPPECSCRPSVDYLFRSLRDVYAGRVLGVVLTGMGEDGWSGCRTLHEAGAQLLAQDEASSTVYGMPRGPIENGIARATPLASMAAAIAAAARGVS